MWLYRASNNVAAFGQPRQTSAGWAIASFFVPIANLFIPYQAIREIWNKSDPAAVNSLFYTASPPGFFPAWWGFWLASNVTSNIYFRMTLKEAPVKSSAAVGILSEVLSIAAAVFAIQVIKEIDRRQEERARNLQHAFPTPPPPPVLKIMSQRAWPQKAARLLLGPTPHLSQIHWPPRICPNHRTLPIHTTS